VAGAGAVEGAGDVHHRRLAGAGRGHEGDHLAPLNLQRHPAEDRHVHLAEMVGLVDVLKFDERHRFSTSGLRLDARQARRAYASTLACYCGDLPPPPNIFGAKGLLAASPVANRDSPVTTCVSSGKMSSRS